jgi:putative ABC transport system ATP-binding protein
MELTTGLACRRLDFQWPGNAASQQMVLSSVTATFNPGAVSLVTGDTGAGKSTLLHLLAGLLHPTAGEVWADGQPVSRWPAVHRDPWRQQVGIVFQHLALIPDLSVAENLLLPLLPRKMAWSRMQNRIRRQLATADLLELAQTPTRNLSGGQRQRLAVARAMVATPRFILADEPTAFQDDHHADQIIAQLHVLAQNGVTVVVCSQDPRLKRTAMVDQHYHLSSGRLAISSANREST